MVAKNALKPVVRDEAANSIEKQVDGNKLSLDDLDRIGEQGAGSAKGVLSVIFETGNPAEIALAFLSNEERDTEIVNKSAVNELAQLLHSALSAGRGYDENLADLRARVARYLLATDLLANSRPD